MSAKIEKREIVVRIPIGYFDTECSDAEIVEALNAERKDGTTLIVNMIEQAITKAEKKRK